MPALPASAPDRIPVYSVWHPEVGPLLSLGMLTAAARHHRGGALRATYDIRPPETARSFLDDLGARSGPAVLLCSDYVFTLEDNLRVARQALELNPELLVVHGGPSAPKREPEAERFLEDHADVAHVLVRGEGERTLCELLEAVAPAVPGLDHDAVALVAGLTFRTPSGRFVRTADRERVAELDELPSPYLSGEFDHVPPDEWVEPPHFETTRGCPYGCTFCDWGSATSSRIRKFSTERVAAEIGWAVDHGLTGVYLCDANFGILPRDVDIAREIAATRERTGAPDFVLFSPAKNTVRHLTAILDVLAAADISTSMSISLQTTDPTTLDVVGRRNISTSGYQELAADLRRRGHALAGDLILGLPGQTYDSFRADLQFMCDHEIMPRTFLLRVLPNSPMTDPDYLGAHGVVVDGHDIVSSTSTMSESDRARAWRLRKVEAIAERYGLLRHVMRYAQWDHGTDAVEVMDALLDIADRRDPAFPQLAWVVEHFDLFAVPPDGWGSFYEEVRRLLVERLGVPDDSALGTVLRVQEHLMAAPGRPLPATVDLDHDYVAYYLGATAELYRSGRAGAPERPLVELPPGSLTVDADPLGLCATGLDIPGDSRNESFEGDFYIGALSANELDSPLVRILPRLTPLHELVSRRVARSIDLLGAPDAPVPGGGDEAPPALPVRLRARPARDRSA